MLSLKNNDKDKRSSLFCLTKMIIIRLTLVELLGFLTKTVGHTVITGVVTILVKPYSV